MTAGRFAGEPDHSHELDVPVTWVLPTWASGIAPGDNPTHCRSCRAPVLWVITTRGKRAPINEDGTSHFANCPDADRWRKP